MGQIVQPSSRAKAYFAGKTVWITGASSGIGEALVFALAQCGAKIILSARNEGQLRRVQQQAGLTVANSWVVPLDLSDTTSLDAIIQRTLADVGRVDVLINNGGISQRSLAHQTELAVSRSIFEVNFFGTIALTKALLPHFIARDGGQIVVVSSLVGKFGTPLRSSYSASKHALHGYFDSLRAELPRQIGVTLVCPGFIHTQVSVNALTADGSPQNEMDSAQAGGMPADVFAKKMLDALARGKQEVDIGGKERYGVLLKRFFPAQFARTVRNVKVT